MSNIIQFSDYTVDAQVEQLSLDIEYIIDDIDDMLKYIDLFLVLTRKSDEFMAIRIIAARLACLLKCSLNDSKLLKDRLEIELDQLET